MLNTENSFSDLSIIIPVGPNDASWQDLLNQCAIFGTEIEVIICACQEQPEDFELPENIKWIKAPQGRASQLNGGAEKSTGNVLWFLHADTQFTAGITDAICSYLQKNDRGMGYFKLKFANDGPRQTQLNAWAANIRSGFFGLPFGDQGFIMSKSLFEQLNGFDEAISVGEDLDFVVRVRALGRPLLQLSATLVTSSRRYQQQGWLSTTIKHVYLTWTLTRQAKQRLAVS